MKYSILIFFLYLSLSLQESPTPISLNETIHFDAKHNFFEFSYERKTTKKSMFFLFYEKTGDLELEIQYKEEKYKEKVYDDKGYIMLPCFEDNVEYSILFNSEDDTSGNFKVFSSESPIPIDVNEEFKFNDLRFDSEYEMCPLILSIENITDKDLFRKFEPYCSDKDLYNISISKNNIDYIELNNYFMYFQKGIKYYIKLEFVDYDDRK